jgi:VanZ family protein
VKNLKDNLRRERFFRYAPLFLWIGLIFFLSSSLGASSNTSLLIRPILEWLFPNASPEIITIYHNYVRKCAHFTEYAVLAFWASRAFRSSAKEFLRKYWYVAAFLTVVLTAALDEFNQSFNPARTGSVYDILLDISGGLTVILLLWLSAKSEQSA